jgi:hypothetical protein
MAVNVRADLNRHQQGVKAGQHNHLKLTSDVLVQVLTDTGSPA